MNDNEFHTEVDGDIIEEVAREFSIGAGDLKSLLTSPNKVDISEREHKMVKKAYQRQAEREGIDSPV